MRGKRKIKNVTGAVAQEQATLFLFPEDSDKNLYHEKVRTITARYYFYQYMAHKRSYEEILATLQNEFFISSRRIVDIINEQIPAIQRLKKLAPKRDWFKEQWAHLTW